MDLICTAGRITLNLRRRCAGLVPTYQYDLPNPTAMASFETPEFDLPDAILHLASDHPHVVLEAEEALFGESGTVNGQEMDATFDGVFHRPDPQTTTVRRTGFVGSGLSAENTDVRGIPDNAPADEDSPMYMNFVSGGTTQRVSKCRRARTRIRDGRAFSEDGCWCAQR